jgi:lipopolysaccharide export system protein LptA
MPNHNYFFPYAIFLLLFFTCSGTVHHHKSIDPLSKIVVTSTDAVCTKSKDMAGQFVFQYRNDVHVTFADNSTITSDFLEIVFKMPDVHGKSSSSKDALQQPPLSSGVKNFKKVTFKGHVCLKNAQRKAVADTAHVFLEDQRCVLDGNVKIWQYKQRPSDIPVAIQSSRAELSLLSGEARLLGTTQNPVSTTIVLRDHPALQHKKKVAA